MFHADDLITELNSIEVEGSENTQVITGLDVDTKYSFRVSVANHLFQSEPSSFQDFQTQGPPSEPTKVEVLQVGSDEVTLSWAAPFDGHSAITSYSVSVYLGSGDDELHDVVDGIVGATFTYTDASPATDYSFTVAATNAIGESLESDLVEATTTSRAPDAPTDVVVNESETTPTSLSVEWNAPAVNGGAEIT